MPNNFKNSSDKYDFWSRLFDIQHFMVYKKNRYLTFNLNQVIGLILALKVKKTFSVKFLMFFVLHHYTKSSRCFTYMFYAFSDSKLNVATLAASWISQVLEKLLLYILETLKKRWIINLTEQTFVVQLSEVTMFYWKIID